MPDIPKPETEHSAEILPGSWPQSSEFSWTEYGAKLLSEAQWLGEELAGQEDILSLVVSDEQQGAYIDSAVNVIRQRTETVSDRCQAYTQMAGQASGIGGDILTAKTEMAESVTNAEATIAAARADLEPKIAAAQAAGRSGEAQSLPRALLWAPLPAGEKIALTGLMGGDSISCRSGSDLVACILTGPPGAPRAPLRAAALGQLGILGHRAGQIVANPASRAASAAGTRALIRVPPSPCSTASTRPSSCSRATRSPR